MKNTNKHKLFFGLFSYIQVILKSLNTFSINSLTEINLFFHSIN